MKKWVYIAETKKHLRIVILEDKETVLMSIVFRLRSFDFRLPANLLKKCPLKKKGIFRMRFIFLTGIINIKGKISFPGTI
jgi:hypothetical protein